MIYAWDNREAYSAATIHFIECSPELWPDVERLLRAYEYTCNGSLVLVASALDWREGEPASPGDVVAPEGFFDLHARDEGLPRYPDDRDKSWWNGYDPYTEMFEAVTPALTVMLLVNWRAAAAKNTESEIYARVDMVEWFAVECQARGMLP